MLTLEQMTANARRFEFDGEVSSEKGIWCPHCNTLWEEAEFWNGDHADMVQEIIAEESYFDGITTECPSCNEEFTFRVLTVRTYMTGVKS